MFASKPLFAAAISGSERRGLASLTTTHRRTLAGRIDVESADYCRFCAMLQMSSGISDQIIESAFRDLVVNGHGHEVLASAWGFRSARPVLFRRIAFDELAVAETPAVKALMQAVSEKISAANMSTYINAALAGIPRAIDAVFVWAVCLPSIQVDEVNAHAYASSYAF